VPFRSQAQNRAFRAAAASPAVAKEIGIPQKVAKKFIADSAGQKVGKLPDHVAKKAHGGRAFTAKHQKSSW